VSVTAILAVTDQEFKKLKEAVTSMTKQITVYSNCANRTVDIFTFGYGSFIAIILLC